mgnify:CR=1 FL=1
MIGKLDFSKLRRPDNFEGSLEYDRAVQKQHARSLAEVMSAPLQRAVDTWNRRVTEGPPLLGTEEGDLNDRIEDETWLLHYHGYSVLSSTGPYRRRSAYVSMSSVDDILTPAYGYEVFSLADLGRPEKHAIRYPATGGEQPGEFELARDHADAIGGVVLERRYWNPQRGGGETLECIYLASAVTPKNAYGTFMQMYDDGYVISRFIPVFERMLKREHRAVDAVADKKPEHFQRLGEISFYLTEVRSWKADRDWLLAQGKI